MPVGEAGLRDGYSLSWGGPAPNSGQTLPGAILRNGRWHLKHSRSSVVSSVVTSLGSKECYTDLTYGLWVAP